GTRIHGRRFPSKPPSHRREGPTPVPHRLSPAERVRPCTAATARRAGGCETVSTVLLAGMIPAPGESPGQWWTNTGYRQAANQQAGLDGGKTGHDDPLISFYNGLPRPLAEEALRRGGRGESSVVWNTPWPLDTWPDVRTKFILCQDDQFFPAAFMRRLAQQRLGTAPDEIPGCHCAALSHPRELSDLLMSCLDRPVTAGRP